VFTTAIRFRLNRHDFHAAAHGRDIWRHLVTSPWHPNDVTSVTVSDEKGLAQIHANWFNYGTFDYPLTTGRLVEKYEHVNFRRRSSNDRSAVELQPNRRIASNGGRMVDEFQSNRVESKPNRRYNHLFRQHWIKLLQRGLSLVINYQRKVVTHRHWCGDAIDMPTNEPVRLLHTFQIWVK